ncbi:SpoIIE family protein phosphatase [Streptomyces roseicoloratus]|uniref:SpoIIE family protein phosphatase n=1 Tax=Streptomyces roseicoloratus TaxID=2508722 RepID=A0ABY9RNZ0_9ACTN|nr:SpoIIE family protein phosphatase [Streptomyces roseicoloratus]WMX43607.1 SpoIIE family protein phosphatase [Streptomyces roseicoloratus]
MLDGLPGSAIFLKPVLGTEGEVTDFRIMAASPEAVDVAGRTGRELVGLSVLETYPNVDGSELWRGYLQALETGTVYEGEPFEYEEVLAGIPRLSRFAVRAAACKGGLVVSWVRLDTGEREQCRLAVLQRLGGMGWADWDLVRNTITWSDEVYVLFDRDPSRGPMTLEELPRHVVPEDLPALGEVVQSLLRDGTPADHVFRISAADGDTRYVRIVAEVDVDAMGAPVEVHGFFQDQTAAKRAEQQLLDHERGALVQRGLLAAERDLAVRLQHALLPLPEQSLRLAGLTVNVAYQPLQERLNVGGDWYSAIELPDGSALLVVGDVAGHGLDAVATMAQLRFTAKGMAVTGTPLPQILARLNTLLLHSAERSFSTATMIMGRYEPATSRLTWVQAGHLPPLLVRDGEARFLPPPEGVLLGAMATAHYEASTLRLQPGDHLLLYTDGLVEKPGEDISEGLDRLARSTVECAEGSGFLDAVIDGLLDPDVRRDDVCALHVSL